MLFLSHKPGAPLDRFVRSVWYFRGPRVDYRRERILPSGCAQLIVNLSRDFLLDCAEDSPERRIEPALIVGQRSVYEIVDTSDFADLIGIMFEPAALPAVVADRADLFSNNSMALEQVWGVAARMLRDRLRDLRSAEEKMNCLEQFLFDKFLSVEQAGFAFHPAVEFALERFRLAPTVTSVAGVARDSGWSQRRFSEIFREQVGFGPKIWCRMLRFQRAVRQMSAGQDVRWADLAIECGFYDQAHLANEFRAFSGIDLTTYTRLRNPLWANHVRAE